ncbi:hypothetical protein CCACVL1_19186 [Corchorus capsularis]|uniref:Chromo domain-containing protein n=1 Tax=Corchorus capsularis TaxID=210143 RepID=A0A1R3HI61_COCAP|nr:hypothetical protein CCACVL1_19186 [Corchorus capsularis]
MAATPESVRVLRWRAKACTSVCGEEGGCATAQLPTLHYDGTLVKEPISIVDRRMIKRNNKVVTEVLVHWSYSFPEDDTWEDRKELQAKYPNFNP